MSNDNPDNKIYFIHRILNFEKKSRTEDLESITKLSTYLKQKARVSHKESLEIVSQFENLIKSYKLEKVDLKISSIKDEFKELLKFIINERIRKILEYQYIVNLKDDYYMIFLPECPAHLVYDKFILFSTTIDKLEEAMIEYFYFIKEHKLIQELILRKEIVSYFKIDSKYEFIRKFVDKFSFPNQENPYRIVIHSYLGEDIPYYSTHVLAGEKNIYISNDGHYSDLNFLIFIKNFYKKFT